MSSGKIVWMILLIVALTVMVMFGFADSRWKYAILSVLAIAGGGLSIYHSWKYPTENDIVLYNTRGYVFGFLSVIVGILTFINKVIA